MMTRSWIICVPMAILLVSIGSVVSAQTDREIVLFSGDLSSTEPRAWGSGNASLSDEEEYLERDVLEIETKGFHQGGRLRLKQPLALTQILSRPENSFLVLTVRVHQAVPDTQAPTGPEWDMMGPEGHPPPEEFPHGPGMEPPPPPEMDPGMDPHMDPGMDPHMDDMPGMHDMPGMAGPQAPPPPMVTQLRALLVTDKGQLDSGAVEILDAEDALENWYTMVIPLAQFAGEGKTAEARLQDIALFGNADEKFWVATVKLVSESQPLVADAGERRVVKVNREVKFEAAEQPGNIRAQYSWDFDDWDGIGEDALGREATWSFTEPGFYVVTLTVTDRSGRRLPQTARVHVKVED